MSGSAVSAAAGNMTIRLIRPERHPAQGHDREIWPHLILLIIILMLPRQAGAMH